MSSSNNGVYPLSLYLSSLSGHQEIIHNPYNDLRLTTPCPSQMVSSVPDSLVDYMAFNSYNAGFEFPEVSKEIKKAVKKDRHSKIHTAQGLRDRRVRLSIGIARQFFDLQDMLGFDKASKTLDWLLNKSRKAIKELVQEKKLNNGEKDCGNHGGDLVEEEDDNDDDDDGDKSLVYGSSPDKYCEEEVVCEGKKEEKKRNNASKVSSRTKAKGKAKQKTSEIYVYDHQETLSEITQSEILDPFKRSIIFNEEEDMSLCFYKEATKELDHIQESILSNREIYIPTNIDQSYNQHNNGTFMLMGQGSSNNYNNILSQNLDFDYDQSSFIDQTFCGVTDTNFTRGIVWFQDSFSSFNYDYFAFLFNDIHVFFYGFIFGRITIILDVFEELGIKFEHVSLKIIPSTS
ncbi:unnamed protein product [Cochlearia groenlandica]